MKHSVHLVIAAEPQQAGKPVEAICQKQILRAEFPFTIEGDIRFQDVSSLGDCRKCSRCWLEMQESGEIPKHVYVYGCVESQEKQ